MGSSRHRTRLECSEMFWRTEARLCDELVDGYVDWRESERAVADAYVRWLVASEPERARRFAAYTATLDQEEKTASAYADAVTDLERWLQHSQHGAGLGA